MPDMPLFELPDPSPFPTLLGRSNYTIWKSSVVPTLNSDATATALLSGCYTEPVVCEPLDARCSKKPGLKFKSKKKAKEAALEQSDAREKWESANLHVCRFIRGTLAMNVLPFVRRYSDAKALWDALEGLYGEANGIEMAGGPPIRCGPIEWDGTKEIRKRQGVESDTGTRNGKNVALRDNKKTGQGGKKKRVRVSPPSVTGLIMDIRTEELDF